MYCRLVQCVLNYRVNSEVWEEKRVGWGELHFHRRAAQAWLWPLSETCTWSRRTLSVHSLLNGTEVEDGAEKTAEQDQYPALRTHQLSLLMMMQINNCTRGNDNGDMVFVSRLGAGGVEDVRREKALSPGRRCQILLEPTECDSAAHCLVSFHIKPF